MRFSPERAWLAASQFPGAVETGIADDGWVVMAIPMADQEALAAMVLEFGPDAVVDAPGSLRDAVIARLETVRG
jgi:predicted DNA-binding transcriptional regulator YafY